MYYLVIPTKIFRQTTDPSEGLLTYKSNTPLTSGQIVLIPLGRSSIPGIIYQSTIPPKNPTFEIKEIQSTLNLPPLPKHLLKSIFWLSQYYLSPLPAVANLLLPKGLTKTRRKTTVTQESTTNQPLFANRLSIINQPSSTNQLSAINQSSSTNQFPSVNHPPFDNQSLSARLNSFQSIPLNQAQQMALDNLKKIKPHTKLLHGITGSGKTNLYLTLVMEQFQKSHSSIILVPEISLTSQLVQEFQRYFPHSVITIHSKQTEASRHLTWQKILNNQEPLIIIGARSAIFSPVQNLGLIIIDEAHDPAFYQENPPRYSALRLASFIANTKNIDCVYGTATPLIEDFYLAEKNHAYVSLTQKAKDTAFTPKIELIDLKNSQNFTKNRYFSDSLIKNIVQNLEKHQQTLIFHNRRGSAPLTICTHCGWQALCPNCLLPLTLHSDNFQLVCHTCGHTESVPKTCPVCSHPDIIHKGFGTKLLETELKKLFKTAKIARFDADNTVDNSINQLYQQIKDGEIDILVGTHLLAKGLDLPKLATVGIVQADSGLSLPDYASEERSFHLLTQVIGRVGRGHLQDASVFIQTYQSEHPIIHFSIQNNYISAYQYLLNKRKQGHFPPYFYIAKLYITQKTEQTTIKKIRELYSLLRAQKNIFLSAPTPAFHEFSSSGYTWQIIIKATSRKNLISAIQSVKIISNLRYILDPPSLL